MSITILTTSINVYLVFSLLILLLIHSFFIYYNKYKNKILENIKEFPEIILIYLDNYYVTNIFFVLTRILFYISIIIGLLIFFRSQYFHDYIFKDVNLNLLFSFNNKLGIFYLFFNLYLILTIIIVFRLLLDKVFFDDFIKLHFYLTTFNYYIKIQYFVNQTNYIDFFGKIYLFFFNICKLRTLRDLNDNTEYYDFFLYETIYEDDRIRKLSEKCVKLSIRYRIYLYFMQLLRCIFKVLFYHMRLHNGIIPYLPRIWFMFMIFYKYFYDKSYNLFYIFLIYYFMDTLINIFIFLTNKSLLIDDDISKYFYDKKSNYIANRLYLKNNITYYFETLQHYSMKQNIKNFSLYKYIMGNFKLNAIYRDNSDVIKSLHKLYKKIIMIIFFLLSTIMLYTKNKIYIVLNMNNMNIDIIYIWIPLLCVLIYTVKYTYKIIRKDNDESYNEAIYETQKYIHYLFWILSLILILFLSCIYIGNIIKGIDLIYSNTIIKIIKYHTINEKVEIFYEYFQKYIEKLEMDDQHVANLKLFIEELNIETIIFEDTTLKDLISFLNDLITQYVKHLEILDYDKQVSTNFKNHVFWFVNTMVLWEICSRYINAYNILLSPTKMQKFIKTILDLLFKNNK